MKKVFRKDLILSCCQSKRVLHLGFIQHSHLYDRLIAEDSWLHGSIAQVADHLVGIDYLEEDVQQIRSKYGYEVYAGDVMDLDKVPVHSVFDVILCGELIEHIENPGLMLEGVKRFMHDETLLILTTPNPWSKHRIRLIERGRKEAEWLNDEHVSWFSFQTLKQLLERKGYREVRYGYYWNSGRSAEFFRKGWKAKLRYWIDRGKVDQQDGLLFIARIAAA
ncbi:MAG: methyltransferase domain-containing protein [Flavobacteriales bacterium]|nr:methyltransferase domain-containing protein [Flavobacteriales bacterium]